MVLKDVRGLELAAGDSVRLEENDEELEGTVLRVEDKLAVLQVSIGGAEQLRDVNKSDIKELNIAVFEEESSNFEDDAVGPRPAGRWIIYSFAGAGLILTLVGVAGMIFFNTPLEDCVGAETTAPTAAPAAADTVVEGDGKPSPVKAATLQGGPVLRSSPVEKQTSLNDAMSSKIATSWLCTQACQGRLSNGCCAYQESTQQCMWHATGEVTDANGNSDLQACMCKEAFGGSNCGGYMAPQKTCSGVAQPVTINLATNGPLKVSNRQASMLQFGGLQWKLIWSDEFTTPTSGQDTCSNCCKKDGNGVWRPDPGKWTYEMGYVRNNEAEWYQPDNAVCKNGKLVITAKQEIPKNAYCSKAYPNGVGISDQACKVCGAPTFQTWWPCDEKLPNGSLICSAGCQRTTLQPPAWPMNITSSSLTTSGRAYFKYGLWEMYAKIPIHQGAFPAWWATGHWGGTKLTAWPFCGEIDMMESYSKLVRANVIYGCKNGAACPDQTQTGDVDSSRIINSQWAGQFHTWKYLWTRKKLTVWIDDQLMINYDQAALAKAQIGVTNPWEPAQPFNMILNLAIGGPAALKATKYQYGSACSQTCEAPFVFIQTEAECKSAAQTLKVGYNGEAYTGDSAHLPYCWIGSDGKANFNPKGDSGTGCKSNLAKLICKSQGNFPMNYEVDYVRVYEAVGSNIGVIQS